ncbi:hypothetical protein SVAN01_01572 [Stagonosporopsis vannaccii]|nr:hypothetical protein SVAN01_01572 [Stagonosporopsis vannaccii]
MTAPADDEWEYEYDKVETEDFYIPIDMSNVPKGQKIVDSERRTGHPTLLKSRLRALNAQRAQQQDVPSVDSAAGQESGTVGEAQIIDLHSENPLAMYNGQLLSLQWVSTIGTDMFFAKPESNVNSEGEKPLRSLPNVDLLATSSAKLIARVGRLRPKDELVDSFGEAEGANTHIATSAQPDVTDRDAEESTEVSHVPPTSFLARLNEAKAKRGDSTRLAVSKSGAESTLVAEAVEATPTTVQPRAEDRGDIEMSGTRSRRDRLSVSVLPGHSRDTEPQSPYLHWLFGESSDADIFSRLRDDDPDVVEGANGCRNTEAVMMREVAAWLESQEQDDFWSSKRNDTRKQVWPTTHQLLARLKDSDSTLTCTPYGTDAFDTLVQAIALQLLASCYTYLPTSSATHLPLFQQRAHRKPVTALRAHSLFRFAPAAGHHARAPSETAAWPGLYPGPAIEDTLAEWVSQKRCSAKWSNGSVSSFVTSGWTDGGHDLRPQRDPSLPPVKTGIINRLRRQPSKPRDLQSKHPTWFAKALCRKGEGDEGSSERHANKKSILEVKTFTVHRLPSLLRPRNTRSTLRLNDNATRTARPRFKLMHRPSSKGATATVDTLPTRPKRPPLHRSPAPTIPVCRTQSSPYPNNASIADPARARPPPRKWISYSPADRPALIHTPPTPVPPSPYIPPASEPPLQSLDYFSAVHPVAAPRTMPDARTRSDPRVLQGFERERGGSGASSSSESVRWDRRRRSVEIDAGVLQQGGLGRGMSRERSGDGVGGDGGEVC